MSYVVSHFVEQTTLAACQQKTSTFNRADFKALWIINFYALRLGLEKCVLTAKCRKIENY